MRQELCAVTKSGKILGGQSFYRMTFLIISFLYFSSEAEFCVTWQKNLARHCSTVGGRLTIIQHFPLLTRPCTICMAHARPQRASALTQKSHAVQDDMLFVCIRYKYCPTANKIIFLIFPKKNQLSITSKIN